MAATTNMYQETTEIEMFASRSPEPIYMPIIQGTMILGGLIGNALIIILHVKAKSLRNPGNVFIIALAGADLGVLSGGLFFLGHLEGTTAVDYTECLVETYIIVVCTIASLLLMAGVAVVRYVSVVHPQRKQTVLTWKWCIMGASFLYVLSISLTVPILTGWLHIQWVAKSNVCMIDWTTNITYTTALFLISYLLPTSVIGLCYFQIFKTYRTSKNRVPNTVNVKKYKAFDKDFRLALQLLAVYVIYNICWCPYLTISVYIDPYHTFPGELYMVLGALTVVNSTINFYVYLLFNSTLRRECRRLFSLLGTNEVSHSSTGTT